VSREKNFSQLRRSLSLKLHAYLVHVCRRKSTVTSLRNQIRGARRFPWTTPLSWDRERT
jgi:hypothetical protein